MQCHVGNNPAFRNVLDASRLYEIFDTYAKFGKPLVLSEIGMPSKVNGEDCEELQAQIAEMLYKVCFSHKAMSGIFWWNLTDDGVIATKKRVALGENLPSTGLIDGYYNEKPAYKVIEKLINKDWRTIKEAKTNDDGKLKFCGFTGEYELEIHAGNYAGKINALLTKSSPELKVTL